MKDKDYKKHKGEYLNLLVRTKGIKIKILAKLAGFDRSSFYNHIKQPDLSFDILAKYGKVINHDFAEEFPEMRSKDKKGAQAKISYEDLEIEKDSWKEKYFQIAELYYQCLEQKQKR